LEEVDVLKLGLGMHTIVAENAGRQLRRLPPEPRQSITLIA
jgi:hypothetical protein